jgi:dephospho-CoA kinase
MLRIGVTGGIGSGKSLVCSILQNMGYPVYNADWEAKQIVNSNPTAIAEISELFGASIYQNGILDSKRVALEVFTNTQSLKELNAIVHPLVFEHFNSWCRAHSNHKIIFKEAAIIFESGASKYLDGVIGVFAPLEQRIKWVVARDQSNEDAVKQRIANQMSDDTLKKLCNYHILNSPDVLLLPQVIGVVEGLRE